MDNKTDIKLQEQELMFEKCRIGKMDDSNQSRISISLCNGTRFFILAISTLCLALLMSNSAALNFTIICMTKNSTSNVDITSYEYSPLERSWLFSIIAVGQILGVLALPYLVSKIEIRKILTVYGSMSSLATLLTPISAYFGYFPLLSMRFFQGLATSICFSSLGSITSQWASNKELGTFISILSMHYQFGYIITMPLAGLLCDSYWGWPSLYYIQGVITMLAFGIFYLFYRDDPHKHRFVSKQELVQIESGKVHKTSKDSSEKSKIPYGKIVTDVVVWGVVLAITFVRIGSLLFVQFGPVYLNKVLHFDFKRTGVSAAFPYFGSIVMKIFAGPLYDCIKCVSQQNNLRFFVSVSAVFLILGNLSLAFMTLDLSFLAQVDFIMVVSFSGLSFVGGLKTVQMISQHHSHVIMVAVTLFASCVHLLLPMFVSILAPDNTPNQWRGIFIGLCVIIFSGMVIFNLSARTSPRKWVHEGLQKNKPDESSIEYNIPLNETKSLSGQK